jgi:heme/copper-type cytochrome/quinol oxidase subunit 3
MTKRAHLGMALFLIAETVFFFLLILACVYFGEKPRLRLAPRSWLRYSEADPTC